jgi:hypothetical protein
MTAYVLISGQLFRAPEQRTSKAGKPFVTATIRVAVARAMVRSQAAAAGPRDPEPPDGIDSQYFRSIDS